MHLTKHINSKYKKKYITLFRKDYISYSISQDYKFIWFWKIINIKLDEREWFNVNNNFNLFRYIFCQPYNLEFI